MTEDKAQVIKCQCTGFMQLISPILLGAMLRFRSWTQCTVPKYAVLCVGLLQPWASETAAARNSRSIHKGGVSQSPFFSQNFTRATEQVLILLNAHPYFLSRSNHFRIYFLILVLTWNTDLKILPGISQYEFNKRIHVARMLSNNFTKPSSCTLVSIALLD